MPTYTANTRTLTAKPRSKRMQQGAIAVTQSAVSGGGSVQGNYLPATNNGDGYDVADKVAFLQKIRIGAPDTIVDGVVTQVNGIDIEVDTSNGAVHVKGGLYADGFISAMGLNPDAPTPGGGGLDEDELWTILGGSSTNHHILPTYLDSVPWASLTNKPDWIGSSKPSYAFNEISGTVTNAQLAGSIANAKLANSSVTIAGVSVSLGGSITQASLRTALGLGTNAYTSTAYLPLSGGTMTGSLVIATGVGISDATTNGMLVYKPTSWTGVSNSQWGVGATDCAGVIRTSGNNLYHYKNDTQTSQLILDSSNYSSYALPLTGGTLTGVLNLMANQYNGLSGYGLNCNNSDIVNVNSILTADTANSFSEGICFYRSGSGASATWDCLSANGGTFYFGANKTYGDAFAGDADISCGSMHSHNYIFLNSGNSGIYLNSNSISWHNSNNFITNLLVFDANGYTHCYHHLMLDGASVSSSTANTTQIVFNASGTQQVALTSNAKALIINPTTSSTTGQIILGVNGHYTALMSSGNTGIGTSSPTSKLHVVGDIYATGAITAGASSSDKRLKKDIKNFNALEIIGKLNPVSFKWNENAKKLDDYFKNDNTQYGLIAQEAKDVIPDLTFEFKDNKYMGVHYEKLTPILLQAVKEQQAEIDNLKKELSELKDIVKQLINK